MKIFLLTLLVAVLFSLGDSSATKYFEHHAQWGWLVLGMGLNAIGVAVFGYVASQQGMGVSGGMMLAMNIVLNTILGIYLFKDHLSQMQRVGLLFCVVGIVILTTSNVS